MAADKPSRRKRSTAASSKPTTTTKRAGAFPDRIFANASPRSIGGISMFEPGVLADATTVGNFVSDPGLVERAVHLLADAGFEVLQATALTINFAGPRDLYESAFNTSLVAQEL